MNAPRRRKPWTREQTAQFIADNFANRIAWVAARLIMKGVAADPGFAGLDPVNRERIERFLRTHPEPDSKNGATDGLEGAG